MDLQGVHSDFCCSLFTILDDVFTVGESARGEERAGQPHLHPGGLLEGVGGGCEKKSGGVLRRGAPSVIRALREECHDRQLPHQENLEKLIFLIITVFFTYKPRLGCKYPHSVPDLRRTLFPFFFFKPSYSSGLTM